ncbi:MAG: iron-sulfur cluster assembly accessory protein [Beijerinckiaceae bacterium]|nr:iron-sulfur cluster assembly accessory protein [Beijerinckiaceae bacterium]
MALKFAVQNVPGVAPPPGHAEAEAPLAVTTRAASRILKILEGEAPGSTLRVSVEGGGCSGFQYKFSIAGAPEPDDLVIERDGVTVLVDSVSAPLLAGSELDFVTELMGQSFQIRNPKATASCGCGTSFAL